MTEQQVINCIGLTFDIFGVVILFKYGLPADVSKHGNGFLVVETINQKAIDKWNKYNTWSRVGLVLIIAGFACQIASTCWTFFVPVPK